MAVSWDLRSFHFSVAYDSMVDDGSDMVITLRTYAILIITPEVLSTSTKSSEISRLRSLGVMAHRTKGALILHFQGLVFYSPR